MNKMVDHRNIYKGDRVVRMYESKRLKTLFLETSHHFGCSNQLKFKFDYHKGLFDALAILKTIADRYTYEPYRNIRRMVIFNLTVRCLFSSRIVPLYLQEIMRKTNRRGIVSLHEDEQIKLVKAKSNLN
ncbi:uncharacterized protein EV154DRAFT_482293 [Mucor mucedo]|uniref:uncharacterized protein n=1 Tax=Mucor mucedo TaxID=29922 RepID=UPI00221FF7D6|nr:uncharacterized protein EV154DRAFT_482293 [Mucor mucedo]KAI7890306.1 hypothetical protein EV154DRAFT_482293 [Mucor mucedo]